MNLAWSPQNFIATNIIVACACCGSDMRSPHIGGVFVQGQRVTCNECCAVNTISLDTDGVAYVIGWVCEHGRSAEEPCDECEIEAGIAV